MNWRNPSARENVGQDAVQMEISDRGRGVELPDRIFEPFFTTKEQGMAWGWRPVVRSSSRTGAKFAFALPVEVKTAQ
jgi:C4-dicarboxylate-specific signal transduction histidine kinase